MKKSSTIQYRTGKKGDKSWKRAVSVLLGTVLSLGLLAGCQSGNASAGQTENNTGASADSVIIAMDPNSEPEAGFDPAYGWGAGEHVHEPLIQSTLTVTNTDLTIGYDLATDYNVTEDGLTWTVTIRDDVRFTDGEPLTAEDVAFTQGIERYDTFAPFDCRRVSFAYRFGRTGIAESLVYAAFAGKSLSTRFFSSATLLYAKL